MRNHRDLTSHSLRKPPASRILRQPTVILVEPKPNTIPGVGLKIVLNHQLVGPTRGRTPMTKVRYVDDLGWTQVGPEEAGLLVFLNNEPLPEHNTLVIKSIIPSGSACYADTETIMP